jgi:deoxycytidylate deaminase
MAKIIKISNLIVEQAIQSDINFQHGAILTKGSKILAKGYNKSRSKFMNVLHTCIHAEIDVLHTYITTILHKSINLKKKNIIIPELSKCTLWVGRILKDGSLAYSKPCYHCINYLRKVGIKKIGYSTKNGTIQIEKIVDIESDYISVAQIKLQTIYTRKYKMCP